MMNKKLVVGAVVVCGTAVAAAVAAKKCPSEPGPTVLETERRNADDLVTSG